MNSEKIKAFDESRNKFKPYGLTCELWSPSVMKRPDRHNEMEINFIPQGEVSYLFQGNKITVPARRFTIFWGLVPHQIINFEVDAPYYVCTLPFSLFLEWKLNPAFVDRLLKGEVLFETTEESAIYDAFLFENWLNDINTNNTVEVALLEIRARLSRMAIGKLAQKPRSKTLVHANEISHVERIAVYIAQNYFNAINASDIGGAVGLHPDYANAVFKKAFGSTLSDYITEERISHAQRKLVATNNSVTEIAFDCGFNSISRFNAAFLKISACTPREYRKQFKV